jgi:hypothetical protein
LFLINKLNLYYLSLNSHAVVILLDLYPRSIYKTLLLKCYKKPINRLGQVFISNYFPYRVIILASGNSNTKLLRLEDSSAFRV